MKKISLFTGIVLLTFVVGVSAQTTTPAPSPTAGPTQDPATKELRDKLENKVESLIKKNQKVVSGLVADTKGKIIVTGIDGGTYEIKVDDVITKFYTIKGASKDEIKSSDIKKGDYIIVTGPTSDRVVTANVVYRDEEFFEGSGQITEVNAGEGFIKVLAPTKETITLDIETTTKKLIADVKELTVDTTTLAKIKGGDVIHFVYKKTGNERERNRFSANKILIIPQEYFHK